MNATEADTGDVLAPARPPGGRWQVRAFGTRPCDLELRFGRSAISEVTERVDGVLQRCLQDAQGRPPDAAALAAWSLARRLQGLIAIALAAEPAAQLAAVSNCSACGAGFEFHLELASCVSPEAFHADAPPLAWAAPDGSRLSVRLPRAADLLAWRAQGLNDEQTLAGALVETVDGRPPPTGHVLPESWAAPLAEALAALDPLTALTVQAACAECGHLNACAVDLESLLLRGFARQQRALLDEVAELAQAFHWTEAQIMELPAWRRAHYLARVGATAAP